MSPELQPMAVQNYCHVFPSVSRNQDTIGGSSGHVIQTETRENNTALQLVRVLVSCSGRINNIINYIYLKWKIITFK